MPVVLCHSPKYGVGTTFLAAHLPMGLADMSAPNDCLVLLPQLLDEAGDGGPRRTVYVLGKLDKTRRFAPRRRLSREVLGEHLIAKIRNDQAVPEALAMLQPLSRYAPTSAALADARLASQAVAAILAQERAASDDESEAHV